MPALIDQLQESLGGDFEILRSLGEGSFAEVVLARERALDRPVAIKILRGAVAQDETARKRFVREARLAAKIHHPCVVAVHRVGELPDGRPYLVMEYIDGRTYADILAATGPLEEAEVRAVLAEVCGALGAAHRLGIIHRDVRPGNIMRTRDGERVVLTDFGLAGILETGGDAVTRLTAHGQILGNVRYAPPEQLSGEPVQPGSDIYSLAVTAYELLTGRGPFPDDLKAARLIKAHLTEEPTPLGRLRPGLDPQLEEVLLRCLQKKPAQRPSAEGLRKRVAAAPGDGDPAAAGGAVESFLGELKRRRVYKVGAAYGAFILVVLAVVDAALPALPFAIPPWTDSAIVMATLAGLPIALVLGWFYDITGGSVRRTPSLGGTSPATRLLQVAGLTVALGVAVLIAWLFLVR